MAVAAAALLFRRYTFTGQLKLVSVIKSQPQRSSAPYGTMSPRRTYINNLTPHPSPFEAKRPKTEAKEETALLSLHKSPLKAEDPSIKVEEETALISPLKSPYLSLGPQTHPINFEPCLHGCFTQSNYGEIAHYYRSETDFTPFPFQPSFTPYDTSPASSSCKVLLLQGGRWADEILARHKQSYWQPCWVVSRTFLPAAPPLPPSSLVSGKTVAWLG